MCLTDSSAQGWLPSPLQWLYPRSIPEATLVQPTPSAPQNVDSFRLKWSEPALAGEGAILVGSVLRPEKLLPELPWASNDIVAVRGDTLYVLSGAGWIRQRFPLPPFLWDVSALLDTLAPVPRPYSSSPAVIALQSVEHRRPDSLVSTYLVAAFGDSLRLLRRLVVDMRPYAPNLAAAVLPFAARATPANTLIYALVQTQTVQADTSPLPYFRGLTQFASDSLLPAFPIANLPDMPSARTLYAPALGLTQPSLTVLPGGIVRLLLPMHPEPNSATVIVNRLGHRTRADSAYLVGLDLHGNLPATGLAPVTVPLDSAARYPTVVPLWLRLQPDPAQSERPFILIAESYEGPSASGTARLHLYDATGLPLASPLLANSPAFSGSLNHGWSIAVGNFDGPPSNTVLPFYPNNPGMEVAASPNTPSRAVAGSRLFILRYRTDYAVPKPQPPNAVLFPFDTIVSAPCSGWIAAAADLDGDGRDEVLLVDRGTLQIWRLRNYADPRFSLGAPFDTVWSVTFPGERITGVVVADVDGDGRADLLVRTTHALHCLGTPLLPALHVVSPRLDSAVCVADTIILRWVNHIRGYSPVRILFQPYRDGSPRGPARILVAAHPNETDTVSLRLPARLLLPDTVGRLLIESLTTPTATDSSPLLSLRFPSLSLTTPMPGDSMTVGTSVLLSGVCPCTDTLVVMSVDTTLSLLPDSTGAFAVWVRVPCPPGAPCTTPLPPWALRFTCRADTFATAYTMHFPRRPAVAPATVYLFPESICPEVLAVVSAAQCPAPTLAYSTDGGVSFTELPSPGIGPSVRWVLPPVGADTVWLRLCCSGCLRMDTVLTLRSPLTLQLLAPNPLELPHHQLQIRYSFTTAGSARLRIVDAADNLIRELVPWRPHSPQTTYCETWDGTASTGTPVPTGSYYVVIEHQSSRWIFPVFVLWKGP